MASPSVVQNAVHSYNSCKTPNVIPISTLPPQEISQLELTTCYRYATKLRKSKRTSLMLNGPSTKSVSLIVS
jgi:hypothetical protein